jgi:hypothetical protein
MCIREKKCLAKNDLFGNQHVDGGETKEGTYYSKKGLKVVKSRKKGTGARRMKKNEGRKRTTCNLCQGRNL